MPETILKREAEIFLGGQIEPSEWDSAWNAAERKLARIIEREGDAGGLRREIFYIAQLIAEAVNENRFSQFTAELSRLYDEANDKMGLKKGQPVH